MEFKCKGQVIDYLVENINNPNFEENHVRPQLVEMLKWLYPKTDWKRGMCKTRQIKHLKYWLDLHDINYKEDQYE